MYCADCGKQIPDDARFCGFCGCNMEQHRKTGKKSGGKGGKSGKWLIVCAAALLVAALAAAAVFVLPGIMGKGTDDGAVQLRAPAPSVPPEELDKERSAATINYDWDEPYAQITSCGAGDPDEGYLIAEELIGRILGVQDAVGGWFRLVAPRDGDYAFTVVCPQLENDTFVMDMRLDGEAAGWWQFTRSDQPQTYVLSGVKAGQVLTWWDNDDTGRGYTLRDPFSLMIEIR